jgi:arginase family enzyme
LNRHIDEATTVSDTFAAFPERTLEAVSSDSIVVFGVPAHSTLPRQVGCANGPRAIRQATMSALASYFNSPSKTIVSLETGKATRFRSDAVGIDLGDLADCTELSTEALQQIEHLTSAVVDKGGLPVLLGGDGRALQGLIEGLNSSVASLGLLVISNRLDLPAVSDLPGVAVSTLLPADSSSQNCSLLVVGVNGVQPYSNMKSMQHLHGKVVSADEIHEQGTQVALDAIQQFASQNGKVVCVIDAEVLDTGYAAGAPGLNVGGLTPLQLIEILSESRLAPQLSGVCVSNVAPSLDARGHSQYATAEALLAVLGDRLFQEVTL